MPNHRTRIMTPTLQGNRVRSAQDAKACLARIALFVEMLEETLDEARGASIAPAPRGGVGVRIRGKDGGGVGPGALKGTPPKDAPGACRLKAPVQSFGQGAARSSWFSSSSSSAGMKDFPASSGRWGRQKIDRALRKKRPVTTKNGKEIIA